MSQSAVFCQEKRITKQNKKVRKQKMSSATWKKEGKLGQKPGGIIISCCVLNLCHPEQVAGFILHHFLSRLLNGREKLALTMAIYLSWSVFPKCSKPFKKKKKRSQKNQSCKSQMIFENLRRGGHILFNNGCQGRFHSSDTQAQVLQILPYWGGGSSKIYVSPVLGKSLCRRYLFGIISVPEQSWFSFVGICRVAESGTLSNHWTAHGTGVTALRTLQNLMELKTNKIGVIFCHVKKGWFLQRDKKALLPAHGNLTHFQKS